MRRCIAVATACLVLQACMHWGTKELVPEQFDGAKPGRRVRVTLADGETVILKNPFISGDSLVWLRKVSGDAPDSVQRQGIPLAQIAKAQVWEIDAAATTVAIVAGVGMTVALAEAASAANNWGSGGGGGGGTGGSCDYCASCPLVYSWDGHGWRLDSGTFGGAITRGLAHTDLDNLDFVRPEQGAVRLKLANQLNETDYVDALAVLAVDLDSGFTVAPDASGRLHTVGAATLPASARDSRGRDALAQVRSNDGWAWESSPGGRDTAVAADLRDGLELAFPRPHGAATARLVVDANVTMWATAMMKAFIDAHGRSLQAWYDSLDNDAELAGRLGQALARQAFLSVAVRVDGRWRPQGVIWDAGPEISKRQVATLDLGGVTGDTVWVRLESVPSFWLIDRVALDYSPERPVAVTELVASRAIDTQGGDVRDLLASADGRALVLEPGDSAQLEFHAPAPPAGSVRSYVLRTHGWYHIHSSNAGEPDVALLRSVLGGPQGIAKAAVGRMNGALRAMETAAR